MHHKWGTVDDWPETASGSSFDEQRTRLSHWSFHTIVMMEQKDHSEAAVPLSRCKQTTLQHGPNSAEMKNTNAWLA
jgi:hypothetical protein